MTTEALSESSDIESSIDIFALVGAVWLKRKLIILVVSVSTVLSIGISLLLQESFLASTIILPETDKSKLSSIGGLSDLASLAGVNVGGDGSFLKLYPIIIKSETVLKNVVFKKFQSKEFSQPVNLIEYWKIKEKTPELEFETALKSLRELPEILVDIKTSVITLTISMPEPKLAADILNEVTSELDKFIRNKRTTSAGLQRKFVEDRLSEVKQDLTKTENILKEFREKNRQILSPQLSLEQERLIRDVQINAAVYTELRKQIEIVKIEEVRNIPVINILDPARTPASKDKPKRKSIVMTTFFLSFAVSICFVIMTQLFSNQINNILKRLLSINKK